MPEGTRILAVNPGGMTTKIAVHEAGAEVFVRSIEHSPEELKSFKGVADQLEYRLEAVRSALSDEGLLDRPFDAVVGRGGLFRPIPSGTYEVNEEMLEDARVGYAGQHASNLGALIAHELARSVGGRAFVVDPVCVDEFEPLARYSGHPDIERKSLIHALNIKATARRAAEKLGRPLDSMNLIVAHLGSGISISPLRRGRMIDVNNALSGGPFSPERTGALPLIEMFDFMIEKDYGPARMKRFIAKEGGLVAYLGTNSFREVEERVETGDGPAREVLEAMAYQTSKEIGAMAAVLSGDVQAVVLTGALVRYGRFAEMVRERVAFIADVLLLPGENELHSLTEGALAVLEGREPSKSYPLG